MEPPEGSTQGEFVIGHPFYVRWHAAFKAKFATIGTAGVGYADPFELLVVRSRNTVLNNTPLPISHWASDNEMLAAYHGRGTNQCN